MPFLSRTWTSSMSSTSSIDSPIPCWLSKSTLRMWPTGVARSSVTLPSWHSRRMVTLCLRTTIVVGVLSSNTCAILAEYLKLMCDLRITLKAWSGKFVSDPHWHFLDIMTFRQGYHRST
jgi:hypothetical protein